MSVSMKKCSQFSSTVRGYVSVTRIRGRDAVLLCHFFLLMPVLPWKSQKKRLLLRDTQNCIFFLFFPPCFCRHGLLYTCLVSVVFWNFRKRCPEEFPHALISLPAQISFTAKLQLTVLPVSILGS
jgi:hypothetical protein